MGMGPAYGQNTNKVTETAELTKNRVVNTGERKKLKLGATTTTAIEPAQ